MGGSGDGPRTHFITRRDGLYFGELVTPLVEPEIRRIVELRALIAELETAIVDKQRACVHERTVITGFIAEASTTLVPGLWLDGIHYYGTCVACGREQVLCCGRCASRSIVTTETIRMVRQLPLRPPTALGAYLLDDVIQAEVYGTVAHAGTAVFRFEQCAKCTLRSIRCTDGAGP